MRRSLLLVVLAAVIAATLGCGKRKRGDAYTMEQVSAPGERACAAMKDGSVRCWGKNDDGLFGPLPVVTTPTVGVCFA